MGLNREDARVTFPEGTTWREFMAGFTGGVPAGASESQVRQAVAEVTGADEPAMALLDQLGLFSDDVLPKLEGTPADILQALLEEAWALKMGTST